MTIETKILKVSNELKRKVEMICKFAYVEYSITNGNVKSIKNTNIAYFYIFDMFNSTYYFNYKYS